MDPFSFTLPILKKKLENRNLPITGRKAELIRRLMEVNPEGQWMLEEDNIENEDGQEHNENQQNRANGEVDNEEEDNGDVNDNLPGDALHPINAREEPQMNARIGEVDLHRELELARMERDLMRQRAELLERELSLNHRESELVRASSQMTTSSTASRSSPNIKGVGELLSEFDGSSNVDLCEWEKQVRLLVRSYQLDENMARILIGSKLKGKASAWFKSKAEYIELSWDVLLQELKTIFYHPPSKLIVKKKFEKRKWQIGETFSNYYFDKLVLANKVPIDESELLEYLIDGIPNENLQDQAKMVFFAQLRNF